MEQTLAQDESQKLLLNQNVSSKPQMKIPAQDFRQHAHPSLSYGTTYRFQAQRCQRHEGHSLGTPKATCQHRQRPPALAVLTGLWQHQNTTPLSLLSGSEAHATSWPTRERGHGRRAGPNTEGPIKVVQADAPLAASSRPSSQAGAGVTSERFPQSSPATRCASAQTAWRGDARKALLRFDKTGLSL